MDNRRWMLMLSMELLHVISFGQGKPIITIEPANLYAGKTITLTCEIPRSSLSRMIFKKDGTVVYNCPLIGLPCSHGDAIEDYSSIDWATKDKGILAISNANSTRDNGEWTCEGDLGTDPSEPQRLEVTDAVCGQQLTISIGYVEYQGDTYGDTAEYKCNTDYVIEGNTTTTCQANGEWSEVSPVCLAQTPAVLSVQKVVEGDTATFECSSSSITSTSSLEIKKDNVLIYTCANIAFTCGAALGDTDNSDVSFTGIGTTSGKGTFTVDNADQARDGGSWVCKYGSSLESDPVIFVVNANSTCNDQTTPLLGLSEKQRIGLIAGGVGVVVVICCSICICAIMKRKANKKKRRRRQERRVS